MAITVFPRLTSRVSANESGNNTTGWITTTTGDGGAGKSDIVFKKGDDWEIIVEIPTLPTTGIWFGMSASNAYHDDFNSPDSDYVIGIGAAGTVDYRTPNGVIGANGFYNPDLVNGDAWAFRKAGSQLIVRLRSAGVWYVSHIFDALVANDLTPFFRTFDTGTVFAPVATIGVIQKRLVDRSTNNVWAGNSLVVRTDLTGATPASWSLTQAPFLGSNTRQVNAGVDGQNTTSMGSGSPRAAVAAAFDPSRPINILDIWEVGNEIAPPTSATPSAAAAAMGTAIANFLADRPWTYIRVWRTIPRQAGFPDASFLTQLNTDFDTADALIVTNKVTYQISRIINTRQGRWGLPQTPYFDADLALADPWWYDGSPNRIHMAEPGIQAVGGYSAADTLLMDLPFVTPSPDISAQPASVTVAEGDIATFSVTATATSGSLTYQWKKRGVNIDGATSSTVSFPVYGDDYLAPVTVVITDSNGSTTSAAATLTVRVRRPIYRRRRVGQTFDYSGAGWFDLSMAGAGLFDRDMISLAAAGPIAALAITEAGDTVGSTSTAAEVAVLGITEANDSVASALTAAEAAALAITEANDTLVSASTATATGLNAALSITEANDTAASALTAAEVAALAVTEANDTLSSGATAAEVASLTVIEAADTLSSSSTAAEVAALAVTEANDAVGSAATAAEVATLAVTEAIDTLVSALTVAEVAAVAITEANDTLSSTATAAEVAALAITEANDTLVSACTSAPGVALTVTEANDAMSAGATAAEVAALAVTEFDDLVASGLVVPLNAGAAITEQSDTVASDLSTGAGASLTITEASDALAAAAVASEMASLAITEADDALASAAAIAAAASLAATEANDLLFAQAAVAALVNAAITEVDDTLSAHLTTATDGGGGATPEEIWNYVLSNGLTAGETLAQALAEAERCCGNH